MNRQFKFRVWDKNKNRYVAPDMLDLAILVALGFKCSLCVPVEDLVLQQFTGLHDKNGKEIYEGDVVKHIYARNESGFGIAQIGWDDIYAGWSIQRSNSFYGSTLILQQKDNDLEVIGNIFENPEYLPDQPLNLL